MLGKRYVIEYIIEKAKDAQRREVYEIYITDSLRIIAENTAYLTERGKILKERYYDLVHPENNRTEKKSANEIINDVVNKTGIKIIKKGGG